MKTLCLMLLTICIHQSIYCQEFNKRALTQADKTNGILAKYLYVTDDGYNSQSLILYKNHTYYYSIRGHGGSSFNKGRWNQREQVLELKSVIDEKKVPVKLPYSNDTSQMVRGFKIAIVKN